LGENILGRGFNFRLSLVEGAGAFVCGEETALISSLEGRSGRPAAPPAVSRRKKGLEGKPTNIKQRPRTWRTSHSRPSWAKGPAWFLETGSAKSPGTKVFFAGRQRLTNTGLGRRCRWGPPSRTFVYDIGEGGTKRAPREGPAGPADPSGGCIPQEDVRPRR